MMMMLPVVVGRGLSIMPLLHIIHTRSNTLVVACTPRDYTIVPPPPPPLPLAIIILDIPDIPITPRLPDHILRDTLRLLLAIIIPVHPTRHHTLLDILPTWAILLILPIILTPVVVVVVHYHRGVCLLLLLRHIIIRGQQ